MEKKMMLMAITAAIAILASSYGVTYAVSVEDRPGVEGLWKESMQVCESEPPAAQSREWAESWYPYSPPTGELGLTGEHRYGVKLTEPEKGMAYLHQPGGDPAGVQGLWPSRSDPNCQ